MKKIYLSVVCLLISIPLIAQLYVEPEKEVAAGMGFLPGGERPPQVQQGLQGLCPSLQAELPGSSYLLPSLPVHTLEKVQR